MKTQNHNESGFIQRNISKFIILIFILQPLMDMLSFFVEKIGSGYSITLLLRFGVLGQMYCLFYWGSGHPVPFQGLFSLVPCALSPL